MEIIDSLHGCLHIGHGGGGSDTIIDVSDVDTVAVGDVVRIDTSSSSIGGECGVVGGGGGTELKRVDMLSHGNIRIIRISHGGIPQLGDGHGEKIVVVLGKGAFRHGISILAGVQYTDDSISRLRLDIRNAIHILGAFTT